VQGNIGERDSAGEPNGAESGPRADGFVARVDARSRAGGVSARMVVSHLDVCSELVALAVRCGAGPDADRPVRRGPAATRLSRGRAPRGRAARDCRFGVDNVFRRARPLGVN